MPFAVTHFLIPVILVDLVRDHLLKVRKILPNKFVFISGLSGLLVDTDVLLFYIFQKFINVNFSVQHRIFFHNIWIPLFFLFGFIVFYYTKKKNLSKIFLMIFIGFSIHLLLDATINDKIIPLYPFNDTQFGLNLISSNPDIGLDTLLKNLDILASIDAILLILWLIHEEKTHHISDFL